MAVMTLTSNRGWSLLQKAQTIAAAGSDKDDAQAAIVLAYSALEAFVSELEWLASRETSLPAMQQLAVFLEGLEEGHSPIRNKVDAIVVTLTAKHADWGRLPLQDLLQLKRLRDGCVHPKPVTGSTDNPVEEQKEVRFFIERRLINESIVGHHVTWDNVVLVKPVAEWACETVRLTIALILDQLPACDASSRARLSWQRSLVAPAGA
jgi:hypothetical protein